MLFMIVLLSLSLLTSFLLTPFVRDVLGFLGLVDRPDTSRKLHPRPTPRAGGVSLALSYGLGVVLLLLASARHWLNIDDPSIRMLVLLLPAVAATFCLGIADDIRGLSAKTKLLGQIIAAAYAVWSGVTILPPDWYHGPTIFLSIAATFWLVLCMNAFNLIDGMDGLAAGVALIASLSLLTIAIIHKQLGLAMVIVPLIGALVGFLYYNFHPASVFMGDSGSLVVGFLLGSYSLMWSQHAHTNVGRFAPLAALALPLLEVLVSIARRWIRKHPLFGSDRDHIHHKVQRLGVSPSRAALALYAASAVAAIIAVLLTTEELLPALTGAGTLILIAYFGIRTLGYVEFGTLGTFLLAGDFRRSLRTKIVLREYEEELATAVNVEQCWNALRIACKEARFTHLSLEVGSRHLAEDFLPREQEMGKLRVDLAPWGSASFGYEANASASAAIILPLAHRLQERFHSIFGDVPQLVENPLQHRRPRRVRANAPR